MHFAEAARTILSVTAQAALAHERGIVHRRVACANVLLHVDGTGKLFPVLRHPADCTVEAAFTAPEQLDRSLGISEATDVWALGVSLYQCLSGTLPYDILNTTAVFHALDRDALVPLRARVIYLPDELVAVVETALTRDTAVRFPNALAFGDALAAAVGMFDEWQSDLAAAVVWFNRFSDTMPAATTELGVADDDQRDIA